MASLNFSTMVWATAVEDIADSAGASGDHEQRLRAHKSLRATFQHLNNRYRWEYLLTWANPISVVAPFGVSIGVSAGQASATAAAGHGLKVDDLINGSGFMANTRITATASTAVGFNTSATATAAGVQAVAITATRDFYDLPTDWKTAYTVKLLGARRTLHLTRRRLYDRATFSESDASTPDGYDIGQMHAKSKIQLLQPPAAADVLQMRYYRRMSIPNASASATTATLDMPEDFESYTVAYAKWHYLTDKGEGRKDQATTWLSLANEGLQTMLKEQTAIPDEDLKFEAGHYFGSLGPNDVRPWLDNP